MRNDQIEYMVNRFLSWRLPENFNPDAGISFKPYFNEHTGHPMKSEPTGTNLFDYTQAKEMILYLIDGMPAEEAALAAKREAPAESRGRDEMDEMDDKERARRFMLAIADDFIGIAGMNKHGRMVLQNLLAMEFESVRKAALAAKREAPADNRNDTMDYWRTRAITAETKILEFSAELEKLGAGRETQLRDALEAVQKEFNSASRNTNRGYRFGEAVLFSSQTKEQVRAALADKPQPPAYSELPTLRYCLKHRLTHSIDDRCPKCAPPEPGEKP